MSRLTTETQEQIQTMFDDNVEASTSSARDDFVFNFERVQREMRQIAVDHGFLDDTDEGRVLALMHSEISEVLEALRDGNPQCDKCPEFTCVEVELADLIIRTMAYAEAKGYRVAEAILAKAEYNRGRPYKHGRKF